MMRSIGASGRRVSVDSAFAAHLSGQEATDLRRWLILHEMTHAWQFAAHPWLRGHMEQSMRVLLDTVTEKASPAARIARIGKIRLKLMRVLGNLANPKMAIILLGLAIAAFVPGREVWERFR